MDGEPGCGPVGGSLTRPSPGCGGRVCHERNLIPAWKECILEISQPMAKSHRGAAPIVFGPCTLLRTWGTGPIPSDSCSRLRFTINPQETILVHCHRDAQVAQLDPFQPHPCTRSSRDNPGW